MMIEPPLQKYWVLKFLSLELVVMQALWVELVSVWMLEQFCLGLVEPGLE
jgi:hypothetical protein